VLRELRVQNYAVIDDLTLELGPGLTALTGETGAGKSLIVGALSLLLGERASSEDVRVGEERARVEAAFDVAARPDLLERCSEAGIEVEDGWLILRREVQREGRNRAWANGSPVTAGFIWELGGSLVELHGQHEHQLLLRRAEQRRLLDAFAGAEHEAEAVAEAHGSLAAVRAEAAEVRRRAREAEERADWLRFKAEDIEKARLEPGEEDALRGEARRLEHSEELLELAGGLHESVYGDEASVVDRLGELRRPLRDLVRIDPDASGLEDLLTSGLASLEELGRELARYRDSVDHDPARLERVRTRLDLIFRLVRKYGETVEDVVEQGRAARTELDALEISDARLRELEGRETELAAELTRRAGHLSEMRLAAARSLEEAVDPLLAELGMEGGVFRVAFEPLDEPGPTGAERVEFLVSLNPGFEPGPLDRIASGGELSRLMLALKTVLVRGDRTPTLVFDEIDAGVGGEVAHRVAARLSEVARERQVFVITHLPQIAARADAHVRVEKREVAGKAAAGVQGLEGEARIEELARMLGGDAESRVARRHARELLEAV
jgi:DNA repair protein RecN (Recombination protein N)